MGKKNKKLYISLLTKARTKTGHLFTSCFRRIVQFQYQMVFRTPPFSFPRRPATCLQVVSEEASEMAARSANAGRLWRFAVEPKRSDASLAITLRLKRKRAVDDGALSRYYLVLFAAHTHTHTHTHKPTHTHTHTHVPSRRRQPGGRCRREKWGGEGEVKGGRKKREMEGGTREKK